MKKSKFAKLPNLKKNPLEALVKVPEQCRSALSTRAVCCWGQENSICQLTQGMPWVVLGATKHLCVCLWIPPSSDYHGSKTTLTIDKNEY